MTKFLGLPFCHFRTIKITDLPPSFNVLHLIISPGFGLDIVAAASWAYPEETRRARAGRRRALEETSPDLTTLSSHIFLFWGQKVTETVHYYSPVKISQIQICRHIFFFLIELWALKSSD